MVEPCQDASHTVLKIRSIGKLNSCNLSSIILRIKFVNTQIINKRTLLYLCRNTIVFYFFTIFLLEQREMCFDLRLGTINMN